MCVCDTFIFLVRYSVHIEVGAGFRVFECLCDICVCWLMYDDGFMDNNHTYIKIYRFMQGLLQSVNSFES